jgi:hypothetical protein
LSLIANGKTANEPTDTGFRAWYYYYVANAPVLRHRTTLPLKVGKKSLRNKMQDMASLDSTFW